MITTMTIKHSCWDKNPLKRNSLIARGKPQSNPTIPWRSALEVNPVENDPSWKPIKSILSRWNKRWQLSHLARLIYIYIYIDSWKAVLKQLIDVQCSGVNTPPAKPYGFTTIWSADSWQGSWFFVIVEMEHWLFGRCEPCLMRTAPAITQPNRVFNEDREPEGPNYLLWSTARLKISAPSSRPTLPGAPNPGSASFKPSKWFYLVSNETGHTRTLDVTFDSMSASTSTIPPLSSERTILKLVTPHDDGWLDVAPIPLNITLWLRRAKWRHCTRHSVIN